MVSTLAPCSKGQVLWQGKSIFDNLPEYYRMFNSWRAVGDVIVLSQRGTGFSSPRLTCRGDGTPVPLDLFLSADRWLDSKRWKRDRPAPRGPLAEVQALIVEFLEGTDVSGRQVVAPSPLK